MSTATLTEPLTLQSIRPLQPSPRQWVDLQRKHWEAGLDPRDEPNLDAAPIGPRPKALTFRGVSIE